MFKSYVYDSIGNRMIDLTQLWLNGSWENSGRILYEYDESSNMLAKLSQTWDYSYWRNSNMQQYTFDSSGNSLTGKYLYWYINWQPYDGSLAVFADHEQDIVLSEIYRYTAEVDSVLVFSEPARSEVKVTLFPNPAHSLVYVSWRGAIPDLPGSLTIYDLRGKTIFTKQIVNGTTGIDISRLNPGVYFMNLKDNRMTKVIKLVKD